MRIVRRVWILLLLSAFLSACAMSQLPDDEQESGISGTGRDIECRAGDERRGCQRETLP